MKKSLIALAALATIGSAAMAQSSVTIYGRLDASIGAEKDGITDTTTSKLFNGNLTPSRLGLRGSEDLGGGLRANFQLESALTVDDGTAGGLQFRRASWVGLSGGFGEVRLGLADSPFKDIYDLGNSNNVYDSAFTPDDLVFGSGIALFTSRPTNQLRYDTPNFGGFTASAGYSFSEGAGTQIGALNVRYRGGPLDVGVALQRQRPDNFAAETDHTVIGAAYNFGIARVSGQYQTVEDQAGAQDQDFGIGVSVPVGSAFDVSVGYARSKSENAAGAKIGEASGFAFGGTYALSKRTRVYVGYMNGDRENAAGVKTADVSMYSAGVRHDF